MLKTCFIFYILFVAIGCSSSRIAVAGNDVAEQLQRQRGLVAFWDFEDTSYSALSGSNKGLQLLTAGSNKRVAEGPLSGYSLQLDGKKDYWHIPHAASGGLDIKSNEVTVIAWVKWSGGTGFVAGNWNEHEGGGRRQYGLFVSLPYYNGASQVCGHISRNGSPTPPFPYSIDYSASPQQVPLNEWVCVAFTYDGEYIKSYFNGVFQARQPELIQRTAGFLPDQPNGIIQIKNPYYYPDGMGNNGSDFTIGAVQLKTGMGNFFKGNIGGVAVFNVALNDADMKRLAVMPGHIAK